MQTSIAKRPRASHPSAVPCQAFVAAGGNAAAPRSRTQRSVPSVGSTMDAGSGARSASMARTTLAFSAPEPRNATQAAALSTGNVKVMRSGIVAGKHAASCAEHRGQRPGVLAGRRVAVVALAMHGEDLRRGDRDLGEQRL